MLKSKIQHFTGFTLLEVLVYISILSIIGTVIIYFFNWSLGANTKIKTKQEVLDNGERVLRVLGEEIRNSLSVYAPTSVFNNDAGQLSLETTQNLPDQESITYHDIFLDPVNQTIFLKHEDHVAFPITNDHVAITRFNLQPVENSIIINLAIQDKITNKPQLQSTINWQTIISLR